MLISDVGKLTLRDQAARDLALGQVDWYYEVLAPPPLALGAELIDAAPVGRALDVEDEAVAQHE